MKQALLFFAAAVLLTVAVHIAKALRLYLIMLEKQITVKCFLRLYIKTTLVNLVLPLKLGELFRVYCFGAEFENYKIGVLFVLVDRYFDTIPLLILMSFLTIFGKVRISGVLILLILFIVLISTVYIIFPSLYRYLNRWIIINVSSKKGILILNLFSKVNQWYGYVQELVKSRVLILLLLSAIAWILEYGTIICIAIGIKSKFSNTDFLDYINSIFWANTNRFVNLYISISSFILMVFLIFLYKKRFKRKGNQNEGNLYI